MSAKFGFWPIAIGGSLAFVLAITIAYLVGKLAKAYIKEPVLMVIGGLLFIGFGLWALIYDLILGHYKDDELPAEETNAG